MNSHGAKFLFKTTFFYNFIFQKKAKNIYFFIINILPCSPAFPSIKYVKGNVKSNQSPLFWKEDKKGTIFRAIYDLLSFGIRGQIKKETAISTLHDISVRSE